MQRYVALRITTHHQFPLIVTDQKVAMLSYAKTNRLHWSIIMKSYTTTYAKSFQKALTPHNGVDMCRTEAKSRRSDDIVRKAMNSPSCTRRHPAHPNTRHPKHNVSGRGRISLHGVEVFPDYEVASPPPPHSRKTQDIPNTQGIPCLP